jgi:hypothetical protein
MNHQLHQTAVGPIIGLVDQSFPVGVRYIVYLHGGPFHKHLVRVLNQTVIYHLGIRYRLTDGRYVHDP